MFFENLSDINMNVSMLKFLTIENISKNKHEWVVFFVTADLDYSGTRRNVCIAEFWEK